MIVLRYNDREYKVINEYTIIQSSREVTFNDITIEFTEKTLDDLPMKYQEVELYDTEKEERIFIGYVNNYQLPNIKYNVEHKELKIELLSPMALATKRTITAIGTYKLQKLVKAIIQPLINDGFILEEFNIGNNQITVNYLLETVESSLNKLSNKYQFWWYIDENKNIYINNIDYINNLEPKKIVKNICDIRGVTTFVPSIDSTDYCNVVNLTNLKLYMRSEIKYKPLFDTNIVIKPGDEITFDYPVDIKKENIIKSEESQSVEPSLAKYLALYMEYDGRYFGVQVQNNELVFVNCQVGDVTDQIENKEWTLIKDEFFSNIITGIKYNGTENVTNITVLTSCSALVWTKYKMYNNKEIEKMKGVISQTGIVEKIVDMKEQWKTYPELIDIANSYINDNEKYVEKIQINSKKDLNLKVGNLVEFDLLNYYTQGRYIVTDIQKTSSGLLNNEWRINLRNSNYLENYIDLFRAKESEESENKTYNEIINNYDETTIREVHEVMNV